MAGFNLSRRHALIGGLSTLFVAPAIVRASSLMKIKPLTGDGVPLFSTAHPWSDFSTENLIYKATQRFSVGWTHSNMLALAADVTERALRESFEQTREYAAAMALNPSTSYVKLSGHAVVVRQ